MNMEESKKLFGASIYPYGNRYINEDFIVVKIRLDILIEDSPVRHPERISKYEKIFKEEGKMSPIWVIFGRKMKDGSICPFQNPKIKDGNHRVKAAKKAGLKEICAIMPLSQINYYKEKYSD